MCAGKGKRRRNKNWKASENGAATSGAEVTARTAETGSNDSSREEQSSWSERPREDKSRRQLSNYGGTVESGVEAKGKATLRNASGTCPQQVQEPTFKVSSLSLREKERNLVSATFHTTYSSTCNCGCGKVRLLLTADFTHSTSVTARWNWPKSMARWGAMMMLLLSVKRREKQSAFHSLFFFLCLHFQWL